MGGGENMTVVTEDITFQTEGDCDIIGISISIYTYRYARE